MANKQLELMGRYMAELGLTPSARSRIGLADALEAEQVNKVQWVVTWRDGKGNRVERPVEQAERDDVDAGKDVLEQ